MATTTRVLTAAVNGTVYTTNANGALEAIDTCHSGSSAPTNEVANGKLWLDTTTTPGILKMYNNAAWEVVLTATGTSQVKLDDIEALADVTDTVNVTSAGALMDSELTAIASVKALNQGVATTDNPSFAGLTMDAANPAILSSDADGYLSVSGDSTGSTGGNMRFFGASHGSSAGDIQFRTDNTQTLKYDASDTTWKFQANDLTTTGTMTAADFVGDGSALTGLVLTKEYVSSQQTVSNGLRLTLAHGLGARPKLLTFHLFCVADDNGFAAGDAIKVEPQSHTSNNNYTFGFWLDNASNINIEFGTETSIFKVINKAGVRAALTNAKWRFVARGWL